jgi:hypothetical protein
MGVLILANAWLNLYKGNPSSGGTDGTAISTGDNTAPITFTLDASINEIQSDTLAVRCEQGYCTSTDTTISVASDTGNHWSLSLDGTNWSTSITIANTISTVNSNFYVKAGATSSEYPSNDTNTKIRVQTKIAAVS